MGLAAGNGINHREGALKKREWKMQEWNIQEER